jgi:hypothetical protein
VLPLSNNTLNVSRALLGAPVDLDLRKAVFRGSPCHLVSNNTLNVSRAGSGAPVDLDLRKAVFRGSPCYMVSNNTLNVSRALLGAPDEFIRLSRNEIKMFMQQYIL